MANYINNLGQIRVGVRGWVAQTTTSNVTDVDATAFITTAGITDTTQISALNTLVNDLKTYGLWTKIKALYPFVGGSAASHKFNLKDPRDLDAAYRLVFNGGWVHSSNGAKPNGTTGYANSFLAPNAMGQNNIHVSFYSRTDINTLSADIGAGSGSSFVEIIPRYTGNVYVYVNTSQGDWFVNPSSTGLYIANRIVAGAVSLFKNNTKVINGNRGSNSPSTYNFYLAAENGAGTAGLYSLREQAFASIGDGLTDTEASNFYISVQKFQTTLGRHVGTPYVSDPDAIAFLMAAGVTDGNQATAINTLVIRMKADGVWTKMKAIYPFVGGTETSHKFNLKDPRDDNAAYRLVFSGGWVHSSTGALPNGTTGYADTFLTPTTSLSLDSTHISGYLRTNNAVDAPILSAENATTYNNGLYIWPKQVSFGYSVRISDNTSQSGGTNTDDIRGFHLATRTASNVKKYILNTTQKFSVTTASIALNTSNVYIAKSRNNANYFNNQIAFISIGDGLSDTDATNLYSAVQAYQTTLGRQVNIPVVSDTDAQSFLNAANITSFQQASAVNKLVVDLKAAGVWTKMKAIYPFVGGSAASHKFNLKDPRDLDAAYRLSFNGGWTHTSTGAKPNGSNGYADTFVVPKNVFNTTTFNHVSYYSRTNSTLTTPPYRYDLGVDDYNSSGVYYGGISMIIKRDTNMTAFGSDYGLQASYRWTYTTTSDSLGLFIGSQTGTNIKLYKNNSVLSSNTDVSSSIYNTLNPSTTRSIWIGTMNELNYTTQNRWTDKESAFISIGEGLNDTQANSLYTAVQTYQTSLGRQVTTPIYNNGLVLNLDAGNANSYPGTGTTWFDLASGNNGTLVNGPTYDTANGGSILFDGTNDYGNFGNIQSLNSLSSGVTVGAWIKSSSTTTYSAILQKWYQSGMQGGFQLFISSGGILTLAIGDFITGYSGGSSTVSVITGSWVYVTATYDMNAIKIYINGVLNSTTSLVRSVVNSNNATLFLGQDDYGGRFFRGNISSATVHNRALTATEILSNFNSTRGRFGL